MRLVGKIALIAFAALLLVTGLVALVLGLAPESESFIAAQDRILDVSLRMSASTGLEDLHLWVESALASGLVRYGMPVVGLVVMIAALMPFAMAFFLGVHGTITVAFPVLVGFVFTLSVGALVVARQTPLPWLPLAATFAAFGVVTKGMDVVRKIHQSAAEGQSLEPAIRIQRSIRLN